MKLDALSVVSTLALMACSGGGKVSSEVVAIHLGSTGSTHEQIERTVAIPLEKELDKLPGVEFLASTSTDGRCIFEVGFEEKLSAETVRKVQTAVVNAQSHLHLPFQILSITLRPRSIP